MRLHEEANNVLMRGLILKPYAIYPIAFNLFRPLALPAANRLLTAVGQRGVGCDRKKSRATALPPTAEELLVDENTWRQLNYMMDTKMLTAPTWWP